MATDNVVFFPKTKKNTPAQTMAELIQSVEGVKKEQIEFLIDDTMSFIFSRLYEEGFNLAQEHCTKSTALLIESFRAALYNSVGMNHPLQDMSENMFKIIDGSEVMSTEEINK